MSPVFRSFSSLSDDSEEARARYLYRQWVGLGLTDVRLSNHTVLLSLPGSTPNTVTDRSSHQCFLPNGIPCDQRGPNDLPKQRFSYAAYSAVGSLQVLRPKLLFPQTNVASPSWLLHSSLAPPPFIIFILSDCPSPQPPTTEGSSVKVIGRGCDFRC